MAKPTDSEIQAVLSELAERYIALDLRLKTNEVSYNRVEVGDKVYKVGFNFDDEDNMIIRIVNRTPSA